MKLLIAEDELSLSGALQQILQSNGYAAECVSDGITALDYALNGSYDAVLLDVMLPGMDGFEVVRRLREAQNDIPVLMLTARATTRDKVTGLNAGADDYLTKPFETEELLARVNALTRRQGRVVMDELSFGDLTLGLSTGLLCRGEQSVQLSRRELDVARLFFAAPQAVLTKPQLLSRVWGDESDATENNVEAYISFLRKKMRYLGSRVTVRNIQRIGYRLELLPC